MVEDNRTKVYEKIGRYEGLSIKRVPLSTIKIFKGFAKSEFCDDYGMTLKYLIDIVFGEIPRTISEMMIRIEHLEGLKIEKNINPTKVFKTNSGKIIEKVKM